MTTKKDNLKESLKETITKKNDEKVETVDEPSLSSLDLLWRYAFDELDEWAKCADHRDEVLLRGISDRVQRNQENIKTIAEQFKRELAESERTTRDEFLMSTTTLQHFFPFRSYEEINAQIDGIQKRLMSLWSTPCQTATNFQTVEKYLELIDQYFALRKKGRMKYITTVKQAGNLLYESQKGLVNMFVTQIKERILPLNKYLEKTEELTK